MRCTQPGGSEEIGPNPLCRTKPDGYTLLVGSNATRAANQSLGVDPAPSTPEAFGAYVRSEIVKWTQAAKASQVKLD